MANIRHKQTTKYFLLTDKLCSNIIFKQGKRKKSDFEIYGERLGLSLYAGNEYQELEELNLNQFDKAILQSAISEMLAGNEYTTPAILYKNLGGSCSNSLPDEMKNLILLSLEKLSHLRAVIDFSRINAKRKYIEVNKFNGFLLPSEFITATISGQKSESIHFLGDSVLLKVAEEEKQFLTIDADLLQVPRLRNTELVIKLKTYLLERVATIKGSHGKYKKHLAGKTSEGKYFFKSVKPLSNKILFDSLFVQCGLSDATKWKSQDIRKAIEKTLNHFKDKNFITEWKLTKKNNEYDGVQIDFEV